jgi:hypothetical protein
MTINTPVVQLMRRGIGLLAMLWLLAPAASADCAKDSSGEVYCGGGRCLSDANGTIWCARNYEGDAQMTRDGKAVCGKGKCERNSRGEIFCSSEKGGAVLKDSKGRVRCYGQCERATAELCEHTRADSSVRGD